MKLDEYILNQLTIININHRFEPWILGQFDNICLNAINLLIIIMINENILSSNELNSASALVKGFSIAVSLIYIRYTVIK